MKALRLVAGGAPLEIHDLPVPTPAWGEVLIRVAGCGVCHTDIGFWQDGVPTRGPLPLTLGHEISGTVVAAPAPYESLLDREVIVPAVIPCGDCDLCVRGRGNACRAQRMPGNDMDGGFAEFVCVPGRGLCVVGAHDGLELAELSVVADAISTPYQAVVRSGLVEGDLAIVIGVGGVGLHCVQVAAARGAHVVAIDVDASRLDVVEEYGAEITLDSSALTFKELRTAIRDHAAARGCPDYGWTIFECSGHPGGQATAYGLLTHTGQLLVIGFTLEKIEIRLSNLMAYDATVQGSWGCRPELYGEVLDLVTSGRIALRPFVETHPLIEGPQVLRDMAEHRLERRAVLVPPS